MSRDTGHGQTRSSEAALASIAATLVAGQEPCGALIEPVLGSDGLPELELGVVAHATVAVAHEI